MATNWLLLSDTRNPALSLALALSEGRMVSVRTGPQKWNIEISSNLLPAVLIG